MDSLHIFQKISYGAKLSRSQRQGAPRIRESRSQCDEKAPLLKESEIKLETIDLKKPLKWHNPSKLGNISSNEKDSNVLQSSAEFTHSLSSDNETSSSDEEEEKEDKLTVLSDSKKLIVKEEQSLTLLGSMTATDSTQIRSADKNMKVAKKKTNKQKMQSLEEEKINHLRNVHHISVNGTQVAAPIQTFGQLCEDYSISPVIINNLYNSGYSVPTPIQMQAIPSMLQGRQILACAPTGSGKTAAFLVPLIHNLGSPSRKGLRALVVCPTRELARQTLRECNKLAEGTGLMSHIISKAGASLDKVGSKLWKKFDILITTPNRLVYILKQEPSPLCLKTVEWLVVDESDKLFEVGVRGFRDQLAVIYKACDAANVKRAMFSATYTVQVAKWCRQNLKRLICITVGQRNTAVELIDQELVFVGSENGKLIAFRDLVYKGMAPPVLIFVQSKERAKELFNELIFDGINVDVIHADRTQLQRDNVVRAFREGKIWVLICTELMGRGMDFKGVNLVINYDFPPSAIAYIHRIGRTGRAGRPGKAITFFTEDDKPLLRCIARVMQASGCKVPDYMLSMKRTSKRVKRQLERSAPDRKPISTMPGYQKYRQNKMKRWIEGSKKKSGSQKSSAHANNISLN